MKQFQGDRATTSIEAAAVWLREAVPVPKDGEPLSEGAECPVCRQFVKIYRRKMDCPKALALILFVREWKQGDWVHVPTYLKEGGANHQEVLRSREWQRLADWGFIESKKDMKDDGNPKTGFYRYTLAGVDYAFNRSSTSEILVMYEGRILRKSAKQVSIEQALGTKFSYADLMAGR